MDGCGWTARSAPPASAGLPDGTEALTAPALDLHGSLCVWPEGILFLGGNVRAARHHHFTASLFFALDGRIRIRIGSARDWFETRGALVAPNVRQEMDARGCHLVNLQIDPETAAYARVAPRLASSPMHELPADVVGELSDRTLSLLRDPGWSPARLWDLTLGLAGSCTHGPRLFDRRIEVVLHRLKGEFLTMPTAADLAQTVGLSEGRLLHLFSQQVGVPLRRYVLWLRLRHVFYVWALSRSLTEAAHAAGFADSAHLSRTFRSMYGVRPSDLFRTDGRVDLVLGWPGRGLSGPHALHDTSRWNNAASALGGPTRGNEDYCWSRLRYTLSGRTCSLPLHEPGDVSAVPAPLRVAG